MKIVIDKIIKAPSLEQLPSWINYKSVCFNNIYDFDKLNQCVQLLMWCNNVPYFFWATVVLLDDEGYPL